MMNWLRLRLLIKHMNLKTLIPLSLLCRVDHRYGWTRGFCHAVVAGAGMVLDLPTHGNTTPVAGYPWVAPNILYMSPSMVVQGWRDSGSGRVCHVLILLWHVWQGSSCFLHHWSAHFCIVVLISHTVYEAVLFLHIVYFSCCYKLSGQDKSSM